VTAGFVVPNGGKAGATSATNLSGTRSANMVERIGLDEPRWAEYAAPHVARYLAAGPYATGRRVLDAGCGTGYGACLLKSAGAAEVLAVDRDPEAVRLSEQRFAAEGVTFRVGDCEELGNVSGPFDVICNFEVLEHMAHPERFLQGAGRLLAAEGVLLVSTPDAAATPPSAGGRPRNRFHLYEWRRDEFRELLAAHFAEVELRVQVESMALTSRREAVDALRQGLLWSNPLLVSLWRRWPPARRRNRAWNKLRGLAAPAVTDFPIVPLSVAPIYGAPRFHFAVCRKPKLAG